MTAVRPARVDRVAERAPRHWALPLLTLAVAGALLVANGLPPRPAVLEFSLWFVAGTLLAAVSRRLEWGYLSAAALLALTDAVSVAKQRFSGAPLWAQDLPAALQAPDVLVGFVGATQWLAAGAVLLLLAWAWRRSHRVRGRRWALVLALGAFANVAYQLAHVDQVWLPERRWPPHAGTSLLMLSGWHPRGLTLPPEQLNGVCCASAPPQALRLHADAPPERRPHIVVVLLESSFDVRRIGGLATLPDPWRGWAPQPMRVFTVGGGTWVQEYALLHGVDPTLYGPDYPFIHHLAGTQLKGRLAPSLATLGYGSTSLMAYDKGFYGSARFHRALGIDAVVGCAELPDCHETRDPARRDAAVLRATADRLAGAPGPQFAFVLTMANHSPHDEGAVPLEAGCMAGHSRALCGALGDYSRREQAIEAQMRAWLQQLRQRAGRPVLVTFFGDHIPGTVAALTSPADFAGGDNRQTIAFSFDSRANGPVPLLPPDWRCQRTPAFSAAELDALILRQAGFASAYVQEKLARLRAQSRC